MALLRCASGSGGSARQNGRTATGIPDNDMYMVSRLKYYGLLIFFNNFLKVQLGIYFLEVVV